MRPRSQIVRLDRGLPQLEQCDKPGSSTLRALHRRCNSPMVRPLHCAVPNNKNFNAISVSRRGLYSEQHAKESSSFLRSVLSNLAPEQAVQVPARALQICKTSSVQLRVPNRCVPFQCFTDLCVYRSRKLTAAGGTCFAS